jgi:hypothetical protein
MPEENKEDRKENSFNLSDQNVVASEITTEEKMSPDTTEAYVAKTKDDSRTGSFSRVVKVSFSIVKQKFWIFILLSILNILAAGALVFVSILASAIALFSLGFYGLAVPFVFYAIIALLSYFFAGTFANQASAAYWNKTVKAGESFSSAAKKTMKAIGLFFRVLFYSGAWIMIIISIIFVFQNTAISMTGLEGPQIDLILMITNIVLGIVALFVSIIVIRRTVFAMLAFPKLMSEDFISSTEALDYSKRYTKGKWWLIVSYTICFSFMIALPGVAAYLAAGLTQNSIMGTISSVITGLTALLAYPIEIVFLQVLMHELGSPAKTYRANPWLVILTILIQLSPVIILGGTAAVGLIMNPQLIKDNFSKFQNQIQLMQSGSSQESQESIFNVSRTEEVQLSQTQQAQQTQSQETQLTQTQQTQAQKTPRVKRQN